MESAESVAGNTVVLAVGNIAELAADSFVGLNVVLVRSVAG